MTKTTLSVTILLASAVGFSAPAQAMSPSESYLAYNKAIAEAETMNDLESHIGSARLSDMQAVSVEEQKNILGFMKIIILESAKKLEIVSEKIDGNTATVETKYCFDGNKATSKVKLVLEDGKWKTLKDEAKIGMEKCV